MNKINTILIHILELIEYKDDQSLFVEKFLSNINKEVAVSLLSTLPEEKKSTFTDITLENIKNSDYLTDLLGKTFTEEVIQNTIVNVTKEMMVEYIKALESGLPQDKFQKLTDYLNTLNTSTLNN